LFDFSSEGLSETKGRGYKAYTSSIQTSTIGLRRGHNPWIGGSRRHTESEGAREERERQLVGSMTTSYENFVRLQEGTAGKEGPFFITSCLLSLFAVPFRSIASQSAATPPSYRPALSRRRLRVDVRHDARLRDGISFHSPRTSKVAGIVLIASFIFCSGPFLPLRARSPSYRPSLSAQTVSLNTLSPTTRSRMPNRAG
jgi:hypothetical protein